MDGWMDEKQDSKKVFSSVYTHHKLWIRIEYYSVVVYVTNNINQKKDLANKRMF